MITHYSIHYGLTKFAERIVREEQHTVLKFCIIHHVAITHFLSTQTINNVCNTLIDTILVMYFFFARMLFTSLESLYFSSIQVTSKTDSLMNYGDANFPVSIVPCSTQIFRNSIFSVNSLFCPLYLFFFPIYIYMHINKYINIWL